VSKRRAVVVLVVVALLLEGANILFAARYQNSTRASLQNQERQFQAAEKRQQEESALAGAKILQRVCGSFAKLAALQPPAGNPATNPSRAFDQQQHEILAGLGPDLGCRGG
jgi:hypothetical protein